MAFCPQCGKEMSDDARFCPSCGATAPSAGQQSGAAPPPPSGGGPLVPPAPPYGTPPAPPVGAPPPHAPATVPPPPAAKKGKGCKIALVIGLIVLLIVGAGAAVLVLLVFKAVKEPVDVTNRYIEAVNDGEAREAWELLHPDSRFKQDLDLGSFEREIVETSASTLRTWNANEVEVSGSRARVEVDIEYTDGEESTVVFELRKSDGDWLVYDYIIPRL